MAKGQHVGQPVGDDSVHISGLKSTGATDGRLDPIDRQANEILAGRYDSGYFLQDTPGDESRAARATVSVQTADLRVPFTPKGVAVVWVMRIGP